MNARFDATVAAIRAEIGRQAADGDLIYQGLSRAGRDRLQGTLDIAAVARAVLVALGEVGSGEPPHSPSGADVYALSVEADERQTERQAPNDASPGEAGH
jgi:hypothetical protein